MLKANRFGVVLAPTSVPAVKCGGPRRPRFVKIWITPLLARDPYSAAAAAPLRISTRSTSSGGISDRRFDNAALPRPALAPRLTSACALLSTITPSTTHSGSALPRIVLVPRSRTLTWPPGTPVLWEITAPVTLPASAWSTVVAPGASLTASPGTVSMVLPSTFRSAGAPLPVTTMAWRETAAARSGTSASTVSPVPTSTSRRATAYPTRRASTVWWPAGTAPNVYSPLGVVVTSSAVPSTLTRASATGCPEAASVTRPCTAPVACATKLEGMRSASRQQARRRRSEGMHSSVAGATTLNRAAPRVKLGLPRRPKPRGHAVDREQQWRELILLLAAARRAVAAQQLDLLAIHLRQRGQPSRQPLLVLREPLGNGATVRHAQHGVHGAAILLLDEWKDGLAHAGVGHEAGVLPGDVEVDVRERLLRLVHDQSEQGRVLEHALQERFAAGTADLEEGAESAADSVPPGHDVAILGPSKDPGDRPQVRERSGPEPPGRPRANVQEGDLLERARGLEVGEQIGMLGQLAVGRVGRAREGLERFVELRRRREGLPLRAERVLEHARGQELDLVGGRPPVRVLEGDHLALLCEPEPPGDRAGRLGRDGASGRGAPAAHRAAAPVEERDGHAALRAEPREPALGLGELPVRREKAAVLV